MIEMLPQLDGTRAATDARLEALSKRADAETAASGTVELVDAIDEFLSGKVTKAGAVEFIGWLHGELTGLGNE